MWVGRTGLRLGAGVGMIALVVAIATPAVALTGPAGIIRVSRSTSGSTADATTPGYSEPAVSSDGRYVAFDSWASNLVNGADGGLFLRDNSAGTTSAISVRLDGSVDDASDSPSISADGRYVAFESDSIGLVAGGNANFTQVYLRDRIAGVTTRLSTKPNGNQGTDDSSNASISADGRYIAFESDSPGLVAGDTNDWTDVFVRDRLSNTTKRVSLTSTGAESDLGGAAPSISADGRYVAFVSSERLVPADAGFDADVYVRDTVANTTTLVSSATGSTTTDQVGQPKISANGRFVAFVSAATNLDGIADSNGAPDVFMRDTVAGTTLRISRSAGGGLAHGTASVPSISGDSRFVSYESTAADGVSDDTNGVSDAFVYDRVTSQTSRISTDQLGTQLPTGGAMPVLSASGNFVTFASDGQISGLGTSIAQQLYVRLTLPLSASTPLPQLSIGNASVVEGNAGARQIKFTVSLSAPVLAPVSVMYATAPGTATSADFSENSGTLTIPAGATSGMVGVSVKGDRAVEPNETFSVQLSSPQSAVLRRATGTGTITNDDASSGAAVRVSIGNASLVEGNSGARTLRFAVTRTAASATKVTVSYATVVGSADAADFTAKSGTVTIPANSSSAIVSISVKPDVTVEPTQTFKVKLSSAVGATIQFGTGTGSILNDD